MHFCGFSQHYYTIFYYPVDISITVFSYSCAVQYHAHNSALVCDIAQVLLHEPWGYILLLFAGKWSSPPTTGPRPPPCYFFSFTAINDHQAVLFGGNQPGHHRDHRVNDCFLMDFESMVCLERLMLMLSLHYKWMDCLNTVSLDHPTDPSTAGIAWSASCAVWGWTNETLCYTMSKPIWA